MVDKFLTLEDVNGIEFANQNFYLHKIDTSIIGDKEYSNVKIDFCKITKEEYNSTNWKYTIVIDNSYFTNGFTIVTTNNTQTSGSLSDNVITAIVLKENSPIIVWIYLGIQEMSGYTRMGWYVVNDAFNLNLKELNQPQTITIRVLATGEEGTRSKVLNVGYNEIGDGEGSSFISYGFVLVNLVKSDFQFNCTQNLVLGKVNKVALGTLADYKPNGDMIGANTPTITVLYKDTYIDATWDNTLNDYCFNLDLSDKQNEGNVRFKVFVEANDVINASETDVSLTANYETINNATKLNQLFVNGGIGRLGANITLTNDLTLSKDVLIIGNGKTLTMDNHKIIVPSERTFKASNLIFTGGENTIQQNTDSKVELVNCSFSDCIGLGSVIDCQVDIGSLENATDFTTILNECTISNCDMAILHGGDLTITNCQITGKIGNKDYPYFLYQTDGEATITGTTFRLTSNSQISTDIEFNSCIFICGANAQINNGDYTELQNNNITGFLTNSQNTSIIDVTYYYDAIEDYITLQSSNGFCHSVSGVDYVFKTNVTVRRVE